MNQERYETLMVKVVDGVASPAEREELMSWVVDKPELRRELDSQQAVKAVTDGWVERLMVDIAEDQVRDSGSHKLGVGLGLGALATGLLVLLGWGLGQLFIDPEVPLVVQLGVAGSTFGFIVLLGVVIRGRLITRKTDKYEDVIR
jgi:ferric-dicitrate binding protein FerR (iron transport regulator)